jgi:hypothetical protein
MVQTVVGFSVWKRWFDSRPAHVTFTVENLTLIKVLIPSHEDFKNNSAIAGLSGCIPVTWPLTVI